MLKLTGFENEGEINIQLKGLTTNGQMAQAILNAFTTRLHPDVVNRTREVKEYVKRLNNVPDGTFFDPCYEVDDTMFVCSFDFVKE